MGKIQLHTREQEIILGEVIKNDFLTQSFYFTGGTALSAAYFHHRESDDLDFFTPKRFESEVILALLKEWSQKDSFTFVTRFVEVVYICRLTFANNTELKVDFSYYPYQQIENPQLFDGIKVDSLIDIAVNKLLVTSQRTEVKDFIDLYFLLQKFSLWDLRTGVRNKFGIDLEPVLMAADFMKVQEFTLLPKMLLPLKLTELQEFFIEKAKELGSKSVI